MKMTGDQPGGDGREMAGGWNGERRREGRRRRKRKRERQRSHLHATPCDSLSARGSTSTLPLITFLETRQALQLAVHGCWQLLCTSLSVTSRYVVPVYAAQRGT